MSRYFYITTPIYYVNDKPHIGSAYTSIMCDILARFYRLDGYEVKFVTGTDEHGQKVEKAAQTAGVAPQDFVDQGAQHFAALSPALNLSNDDFIRTTEPRHKHAAQALWAALQEKGHIYLGAYKGWYSVRDEAFYGEDELVDGKAPTGAPVEWVEEPSYFFRLSAFQQPLLDFYHQHPDFIAPESRRNEVLRFVEGGLHDLSISRTSFKWGVAVPQDPAHIMYVWLDALTNYLTVLGYPDRQAADLQKFWPEALHVVGKDILRFHTVYWPAFLMAADLQPPKRIFAHGWWTNEGVKISKSLGNVIDPLQLIETYGLDTVRYFLAREVPFGNDGDFSQAALRQRANSDLSNSLGNLVQRVLSFIQKAAGGVVPIAGALTSEDQALQDQSRALLAHVRQEFSKQAIHKACEAIWDVVGAANRYVDSQKPWALAKTDTTRMNTVLYILLEVIRQLALVIQPLMPGAGAAILDQLAVGEEDRGFTSWDKSLQPGAHLPVPQGIFPRLTEPASG